MWEEEDWCTWELPASLDVFDLESRGPVYVGIGHAVMPSGADYWTFVIQWLVDFDPPTTYEFYEFRAGTDRDKNPEGELIDEEWFVLFDEVKAILYSDWTDEDNDGVPDNLDWFGTVSFTVKITRSPHVA